MVDNLHGFFGASQNRPNHPDFWRISETVLHLDSGFDEPRVDQETLHARRMAEVGFDSNSVSYMALQRAMRTAGIEDHGQLLRNFYEVNRLAGAWVDAFCAGVLAERGQVEGKGPEAEKRRQFNVAVEALLDAVESGEGDPIEAAARVREVRDLTTAGPKETD